MASVAQTIAERHLQGAGAGFHREHGTVEEGLKGVGLFFATPFIGLAYLVAYAFIGAGAVACYGLKAIGVQCGVFKN